MRKIKYIFFHTAAADIDNVDANVIDRWHKDRGWSGIGYNYVIIDDRHDDLADGEVQRGRSEEKIPAQVLGVNKVSIGICCVGHGDRRDFTKKQKKSLVKLISKLCLKHDVPVKYVLGHREINKLIAEGEVPKMYRTSKSCPGKKVDTDEIRSMVAKRLESANPLVASASENADEQLDEIRHALAMLDAYRVEFGNAEEEWSAFYANGEIRGLMESAEA